MMGCSLRFAAIALLPPEGLLPAQVDAREPPADQPSLHIEIQSGPLAEAIAQLSRQAAVSVGSDGSMPVITTHRVHDARSVEQAFAVMLAGSGFAARRAGRTAWRITREKPPARTMAFGDEPRPAPPSPDSGSILVTAAKRAQPLRNLARSVSVVRFSDAERHDPASATGMVAGASEGLTLTALGPGRNRMFLRGVADSPFDGASQATVAVLVDDSRLTYSAPDPDLRLVDVDRVELLKGPQGSLYGTGALGGIYHIVTNRAAVDETSGSLSAGIISLAHGGTGASAAGQVNWAVAPDVAALRLVAYAIHEPGWIDTGPRRNSNKTNVEGGRADLGLNPGGNWRIDVAGLAQYINTADSQYAYAPGARSRPAQLPEPHDNDLEQVSTRAAGPIGTVAAVLVTSYSWHEVNDSFDATTGAGAFGLPDPQLFRDLRRFTVWDSEARFTGRMGAVQWLGGLDHVEASEHELRFLTLPGLSQVPALLIDTNHSRSSDTGLFTSLTLPLTDRLAIEAGGRIYHSVLHAQRLASGMQTADEVARTGVTPSAALIWQPQADRLIWLRYGSAFRQGGLDYDTTGKVHAFAGDNVSTVEAGWREQLGSGGQLDIDSFFTWWHDMQSDMLLADGLIETRNAGDARIIGGEVTLARRLGKAWQLALGVTAQSAELVQNHLGIPLDDSRLPVIPGYTLRGQVDRSFHLAGGKGRVGLMLRYLGPARLSFDPRLDRPMSETLDSRLDASLDWGRTTLAFKIDNLFGRGGDTFAFGNPFRVATPQYTPQPPLSTTLSLTRNF